MQSLTAITGLRGVQIAGSASVSLEERMLGMCGMVVK